MTERYDTPYEDSPAPAPQELVRRLVDLLVLEPLEENLYRGHRTDEPWVRVFGGQVIGQALMAACQTVAPDRIPHSLHAYFIRPGDPSREIVYQVARDRDGGSFSVRRVVAIQNGKTILNLSASFQRAEEGFAHQDAMPLDVPPPEALESERSILLRNVHLIPPERRDHVLYHRPLEFRPVNPAHRVPDQAHPPHSAYWVKAVAPLPDDAQLHRVLLAYASDMVLLATSVLPHGVSWFTQGMQEASLDHALWIHAPFRLDEWLLYAMHSPWAGQGRGLNYGQIFTRDGRLVASVAQEGLIRLRK